MLVAIWTLIGVVIAGLVSLAVDARASHRQLRHELRGETGAMRAEMGELRTELRADLRGETSGLRAEMGELRTELRADLRGETGTIRAEVGELATELRGEMRTLRTEVTGGMTGIREELHRLAAGQAAIAAQVDLLARMAHTHEKT